MFMEPFDDFSFKNLLKICNVLVIRPQLGVE
jgi:hypothetical protein